MGGAKRGGADSRAMACPLSKSPWRLLVAALFIAALLPSLLVRFPAMVDYPNHLARIGVEAAFGGADANAYYRAVWAPTPNLALDLLAPPLARIVGPEAAVKAFLLLAQALVFLGALALERAVKGRVRFAPFAAAAFLYNTAFGLGFLNFEFGFGLALLALAAWIKLASEGAAARLVFVALAEPLLYCAHLFALGLFGFVAGLVTLGDVLAGRRTPARAALDFAILAAPLGGLALFMQAQENAGATHWALSGKLTTLFLGFSASNVWLSRFDAIAVAGIVVALAVSRGLKWAQNGGIVVGGLAALYLAMPGKWRGGDLVDVRVITALLFIGPAFVDFTLANAREAASAAFAALMFAAANLGLTALAWSAEAADFEAIIASFGKLGQAPRVLVAFTEEGELPDPLRHAPTLAASAKGAFVADLFAYRGQQPIEAVEAVRSLATPEQKGAPSLAQLDRALKGDPVTPEHLRDWPAHFDALYVIGPRADNPAPGLLAPFAAGARFAAYRVTGAGK